jgi:hypothetical protein
MEAIEANFNLTIAQYIEVIAAHMALHRHKETIAISNAINEGQ